MNKKSGYTVLVFTLLASTMLLLGTYTHVLAPASEPRIYVDPLINYAEVGETFSIDINVAEVTNLYGFEFKLGYNTSLLDAVDAIVQPFLNEPISVLREEINDEFGFVWIAVTSQYPAEPVDGNGTLATITFQVTGLGECVLDLYDTKLSDPDGFPIDHTVEDGFGRATRIIRVPEDYPTVQAAVDAAGPGDTIIVAPGTYHESIVINKTVTIIGTEGSSSDFDGGGSGIAFTIQPDAPGTIIENVVITWYDQGIFINNTNNCQIYDNIMYWMDDSGIAIKGNNAVNNLIEDNIIYSNNIAINVTESSINNTIYNNTISSNNIGLNLESGENLIYNNTISDNNYGINMTNSSGNTIYWNNFIDNTYDQVITSYSLNNNWDNSCEGNYWSDYTGTDSDGDGIGDTPYVIDENNQDNFPLMAPYLVGDINHDGIVDASDLFDLSEAYGSEPGNDDWNCHCDLNKDGRVDAFDIFDLSKNYGKTA